MWLSGSGSRLIDTTSKNANDAGMGIATEMCVIVPGRPACLPWNTERFRRGTPADDFRRRVRAAVRAVMDGEPIEYVGLGVAVISPEKPGCVDTTDVGRTVRLALAGMLFPLDSEPVSNIRIFETGTNWAVRVWWWRPCDCPENNG